jgi:hypothetical protein
LECTPQAACLRAGGGCMGHANTVCTKLTTMFLLEPVEDAAGQISKILK